MGPKDAREARIQHSTAIFVFVIQVQSFSFALFLTLHLTPLKSCYKGTLSGVRCNVRNKASEKGSHLYCRVVGWRIASSVVGRANSKMRADPADLLLNWNLKTRLHFSIWSEIEVMALVSKIDTRMKE